MRIIYVSLLLLPISATSNHTTVFIAFLRNLTRASLSQFIEGIRSLLFEGFQDPRTNNQELINHRLFVQQFQYYLTLKEGIKHADLGLLRRSFTQLAMLFQGTNKHNYAFETFYLHWLTNTDAADQSLQRALLAGSLVNNQGRSDSWLPIDLDLELHNGYIKQTLKDRHTSSIDMVYLLNYCVLNATAIRRRLRHFEILCGIKKYNNKHARPNIAGDIRLLALGLCEGWGSTKRRSVPATDLYNESQKALSGKIGEFNDRMCGVEPIVAVEEDPNPPAADGLDLIEGDVGSFSGAFEQGSQSSQEALIEDMVDMSYEEVEASVLGRLEDVGDSFEDDF